MSVKYTSISFILSAMCSICSWESSSASLSVDIDLPFLQVNSNAVEVFVPGTKWCGPGNRARNYNDLGKHSETDKCCRAHDSCEHSIASDETKYSLNNNRGFTMSECKCDDAFEECLKKLKKTPEKHASKAVKHLFFHTLKMQCFTMENGVATWRKERCLLLCRIRNGLKKLK